MDYRYKENANRNKENENINKLDKARLEIYYLVLQVNRGLYVKI